MQRTSRFRFTFSLQGFLRAFFRPASICFSHSPMDDPALRSLLKLRFRASLAFIHRSVHCSIFCVLPFPLMTSLGFLFCRQLRAPVRSLLAVGISYPFLLVLRVGLTHAASKPPYEWGVFIASFILFRMVAPSTSLSDFWNDMAIIF